MSSYLKERTMLMCSIIRWTLNKVLQEQTQKSSTSVKHLFPRTSWILFKSQNIRKDISHIRKSGKTSNKVNIYVGGRFFFFCFISWFLFQDSFRSLEDKYCIEKQFWMSESIRWHGSVIHWDFIFTISKDPEIDLDPEVTCV